MHEQPRCGHAVSADPSRGLPPGAVPTARPAWRPVVLQAHEVRAVLDGAKTQLRAPVAGCRVRQETGPVILPGPDTEQIVFDADSGEWYCDGGFWHRRCPFGVPGDCLWVREAWAYSVHAQSAARDEDGPFVYAADHGSQQHRLCDRWRPSTTMPRWASRVALEVVSVGLERLHAISEADAWAEGVDAAEVLTIPARDAAVAVFSALWEKRHGVDSWDPNPWVWRVVFRRA